MFRLPETQVAPTFTGTFVADNGAGAVSPFVLLAAVQGMALTGREDGMLGVGGAFINRPPLAWGGTGTVAMTYTANLGTDSWEGVSGCYFVVNITERRDYLVLVAAGYRWATSVAHYEYLRLTMNGSATGIMPPNWYKRRPTNAVTSEYELSTCIFVLRDWEPGIYTGQLWHSPWGSTVDRAMNRAYMALL